METKPAQMGMLQLFGSSSQKKSGQYHGLMGAARMERPHSKQGAFVARDADDRARTQHSNRDLRGASWMYRVVLYYKISRIRVILADNMRVKR